MEDRYDHDKKRREILKPSIVQIQLQDKNNSQLFSKYELKRYLHVPFYVSKLIRLISLEYFCPKYHHDFPHREDGVD